MTAILLHLMRHGVPKDAGWLHGHNDAAPLPSGIAACVTRAASLRFGSIVSSDLTRAAHAAERIATRHGLVLTRDRRWHELDFGQWEGCDPATLPTDALGDFWRDPQEYPPPGGERWSTLRDRVADAIDAIDGDTLVVTHGGAIRAAIATLLDLDQRTTWAFALPYAAVLSLRVWPRSYPRAQIIALVGDAA